METQCKLFRLFRFRKNIASCLFMPFYMCVFFKNKKIQIKKNIPFFHSSGPRAVQDGSGGAMGLQLHSCLLLLVILPFLLRV